MRAYGAGYLQYNKRNKECQCLREIINKRRVDKKLFGNIWQY